MEHFRSTFSSEERQFIAAHPEFIRAVTQAGETKQDIAALAQLGSQLLRERTLLRQKPWRANVCLPAPRKGRA